MPLPAPGSRFPDQELPDLAGVAQPLSASWTAGSTLLVLGHGECGTTRLTLPFADRLHRSGARVVAVLQDSEDDARQLREELGLGLPLRLEADPYPLAAALGLDAVPSLYLVDAAGRIRAASEGFARADLVDYAERLGVAPPFNAEDQVPARRPG